ncbi:MAG: AMP-binding protein [Acidimicrobiales bacterium]
MTAQLLGELVAEAAVTDSSAPAVVDVDRTLDYGELNREVGQMAAALTELGVRPGDRVGVHLHKAALGTIAMHGAARAGAVGVPLDPASPATRLSRICRSMDIDVAIAHPPKRASIEETHSLRPFRAVIGVPSPDDATPAIDLDDLAQFEPVDPIRVSEDSAAYVITTSGSTGEPKGIVHTHRSALAYVDMSNDLFGLVASDRVADIAPHHFDISTHSLWAVPRAGAASVVIPEPHQRLPASHSARLQTEGVTVWYSVPFLLQQLLLRGDLTNRDLGAIRWVHFGGELISPQVIADLMPFMPNSRFANLFGPAETNQCCVAVFDTAPDPERTLSIGTPCGTNRFRLTDLDADEPSGADVVVGRPGDDAPTEGELWVASPTLMRGYWGRKEADSSIVIDADGTRWYRTGDIVSVDHDRGDFTFHGRADNQVKLRGHRVELEGIEVDLEQLDHAESVIAAIHRPGDSEDSLVVGLIGTTGRFDRSEFVAGARSVLPPYLTPSQIVHMNSKKLTGSGKLDRRALRNDLLDQLAADGRMEERDE